MEFNHIGLLIFLTQSKIKLDQRYVSLHKKSIFGNISKSQKEKINF